MRKPYYNSDIPAAELKSEGVITQREPPYMDHSSIVLSVVVPAYNEAAVIYDNLIHISEVVADFCPSYEIIVVNDGSTDNTFAEIMRARREDHAIKLVNYRVNRGKGGAIKEGINFASGEYIAFLDADLDLPAEQLEGFLHTIIEQNAEIVIGSKMHKDSKIDYPPLRKIMSYGYYFLLKILFQLDLKDTQTGIKLFRADILKPIANMLETTGYAFDIELLARASAYGFDIVEMPVTVNYTHGEDNGATHIRIFDIMDMFFDTIRIYLKLKKEE